MADERKLEDEQQDEVKSSETARDQLSEHELDEVAGGSANSPMHVASTVQKIREDTNKNTVNNMR